MMHRIICCDPGKSNDRICSNQLNLFDYDLDTISKVLKNHNLDLSARAEQISIEVFVDIANNYKV